MNKAFVAIAGASALLASSVVFAGGPTAAPANNSAGFFVSGNVGYGHYDVSTNGVPAGVTVDRNSFSWAATAGYQFNPYVAVEAGYMELPYLKVSQGGESIKLKTHAVIADVKGVYPINAQFDVFGKAGLAYESQSGVATVNGLTVKTDNDAHHIAPLFGLGVDYNIDQNWAVGLQGVTTLKSGDEFPATYTALVGVTYKFS